MTRIGFLRQIALGAELAGRDLLGEWRMTLCLALGLAAVLAPLMVLFGLRFGVVETMRTRLIDDPRNREIVVIGSGRYDDAWFAAARARPDVGFVLPRTRTIAATLDVRARTAGLFTMELVPTAAGDPLVPPDLPSAAVDAAILSAEAARLLGVRGGERIEAFVSRSVGERTERQRIDLAVAAVLPAVAFARPALFVPVDLLVATENYRDGLAVPAFGWPGREPTAAAPVFAGFRMFARSIDDVAGIEAWLRGHDIEVRTKAAEIETMKAFDRNLAATFAILAAIASAGYLLSLAASLWANIERKRRDLSILRLIGWQTLGLVAFPVFQAALTALLGAASAAGLFLLAQAAINRRFAGSLFGEESVCRLLPEHYLIAFAATLAAALAAASWSAWRASRIEPWEGLRDV